MKECFLDAAGRPYDRHALGRDSRKVSRAADGRPQSCEPDPHPSRAAQARPQGRPRLDPGRASAAARLGRDRQGVRHDARGPEVRPGQGQQSPANVPYLAVEDHRRPVGAPAVRAGRAPALALSPSRVFVITGPSGVGKGTLIRGLRSRIPALELSVSATTRQPRPGEENGADYHFLSDAEFDERLRAGEFVEHASYSGNRYGTLRSELARRAAAGVPVVLEIEVQGARQIREAMPEAEPEFGHVVVNDRLETAVGELERIVRDSLDRPLDSDT